MVLMMHYCGSAVLEAHGRTDVPERIAAGTYITTLAFSEVGSRSMFWAPMSTAVGAGDTVTLDAERAG